ncbi:MAG: pepT [Candidatus Krumholzibacteriota bacterium]|nr:pepT [Candidatus Krumholzibacteriota bacterium]
MKHNPPRESVLDRFLRYVKIDTQSQEDVESYPSTAKQLDLLRLLAEELKTLGVADAAIDPYGYVTGTLPATLPPDQAAKVPVVAFIAHADTSPAVSGAGVKPVIHKNYRGGDIALPGDPAQVISVKEYPNLEKRYIGMDIVTSDGTTLLGADDKAGVAEIMTAVDILARSPEIQRGAIKIGFTPDEEVGAGTKYFDVEKFGANFAYTLDGGPIGEIEFETFNAFLATIKIQGVAVHPGYAKDKLVNAIRVLADIVTRLPRDMAPETTEARQGYIHPYDFSGQAEAVTLKMLLRDFDMDGIEKEKEIIARVVEEVKTLYPKAKIDLEFKEQYLNMRYPLEKDPRVLEYADEAIRRAGIDPHYTLIRGGTDGSKLTFAGLLTPNLFAGGEAFHSRIEWVPVQVMEKAVETIINLAVVWAEKSR